MQVGRGLDIMSANEARPAVPTLTTGTGSVMNSASLSQPRAEGPRGKLQYLAADGSLCTLWLEQPIFSIGRKGVNDLHLSDTRISRFHAEIIREYDSYILPDKGSR